MRDHAAEQRDHERVRRRDTAHHEHHLEQLVRGDLDHTASLRLVHIALVLGLPADAVRRAALEVGRAGGAQLGGRRAIPAELAEPADEERPGRARQAGRQAGHQPLLDVLGDRIADAAMTGELARQVGRARGAVTRDSVERRRFVDQVLERDPAGRVAARLARGQLDLDGLGSAHVAVLAHAGEGTARDDPGAMERDQALDPKLPVGLAAHREHVIDRHDPSLPRLSDGLVAGRTCASRESWVQPRSRTRSSAG